MNEQEIEELLKSEGLNCATAFQIGNEVAYLSLSDMTAATKLDHNNIETIQKVCNELGYSQEEINEFLEDYYYETIK